MTKQQIQSHSANYPRAVLITGAAKRIGRALALDFAAQGWRVAAHYNTSADEARSLVEEITETTDGFDKLGAYGFAEGSFRWLVDTDNDGSRISIARTAVGEWPSARGTIDADDANGDEVGVFDGTSGILIPTMTFKRTPDYAVI